MTAKEILAWGHQHHLQVDQPYLLRLSPFWDLLEHWNRKVNLTGYNDRSAMISGLLLPSLAMAVVACLSEVKAVMDVGSGAGIPGLPLAALFPSSFFRLVEPREKRVLFLREGVRELGLGNVEIIRGRIEDLPVDRDFPRIVSRAIDPHPLIPVIRRHLSESGWWWIQTGPDRSNKNLPPGVQLSEVSDPSGRRILFWGIPQGTSET